LRGLWLEAAPGHLLDRVAARRGDASDATPDVVREQIALETGELTAAWTRLDASGDAAATLERARQALGMDGPG
jgi:predicted kinase